MPYNGFILVVLFIGSFKKPWQDGMINESLCSNLGLKWPAMVMVVVYCLFQVRMLGIPSPSGTHSSKIEVANSVMV
jgi:hypothetical protein